MTSNQSPFRPDCLSGRVALVTGGGSGIGFEIARQIGLHGGRVILMGRRDKFLQEAASHLRDEGVQVSVFVGDVRKRESAEAAVAFTLTTYGRLDTLVNGAAGNFLANAAELKLNGFKTVLEIDTVGTFNMSSAAFEALKASGEGAIVNISMTLHFGAFWFQAHACAAKAGVDSLTRNLALEWGRHNIRVNGIAPGAIADTPGMTKLGPGMGEFDMAKHIPLGRAGTKWDIGVGVVYLLSPAAAHVSGHTLVVDGAEWLYRPPIIPPESVSQMSRAVEAKSRAMAAKSKL